MFALSFMSISLALGLKGGHSRTTRAQPHCSHTNPSLVHNSVTLAEPAHLRACVWLPLGLQTRPVYAFLTRRARPAVILRHQMALLLSVGRNDPCHTRDGGADKSRGASLGSKPTSLNSADKAELNNFEACLTHVTLFSLPAPAQPHATPPR